MKISTKGQYAVRLMVDLAKSDNVTPLNIIASNQQISVKYLEQIVSGLTKAKLLESSRGHTGGYKLTKPANQISIKDILKVTGDTCALAPCVGGKCERSGKCYAMSVWNNLGELIDDYLSKISLQNLIDRKV
ncbi:MAG: Rrf2 family transcriptional regulator [Eubacteriales bacterium]|nr:Rrf2 family transcriptional regulator [Eubacteriales bacterium]